MGRKRRKKSGTKKLSPAKLKSVLIKHFLKNPKKRLNAGQLAKKLQISDSKNAINYALESLMKDQLLRHISDGRYVLNKKEAYRARRSDSSTTYEGSVSLIRSGSAYVIVEALDKDVYVPSSLLAGAMNGDIVEVAVRFVKFKNPEGRVVKIVKRNTTQMTGRFQRRNKFAVVTSTNPRINISVNVKKEHYAGARDGDRVLIHITKWRDEKDMSTWGEVKKVFKELDDHEFTMESILVENGFSSDYPPGVMKETMALNGTISEEEIEKRRDFRDVLTFTIDPDTAQDFDDALSFQVLENEDIEVGVHIADVTHYVKPGTALDKEAYARSTSVYLVDRCIAMLPEKLSNELCSLKPNVDRFTFSAVFTFDKKHNLINEWFGRTVIHSDKRFTYEEAQLSLDNVGGLYHKELAEINRIAYKLRDEKFKNGAINFETDEVKFMLGEDNKPTGVFVKSRKDAHMLIEDFMLLANKRVARFISTKSKGKPVPFIYRIHDLPDLDRLADLTLFMLDLGIKLDLSTPEKIAESFNQLSYKAKEDPASRILMQFAIRTMAKAVYSSNNIGHYGLRFAEYSHFTSPIRRYSDIIAHRILEKNLQENHYEDKNKLEARCMHISKQERKAMDAERDSIKFKQVEFISEHVGEVFNGVVSGMFERGIFVELSESKAEGMVPFDRMNKYYSLAPGRFKAVSRDQSHSIKIGDSIKVIVLSADLNSRQIELDVVED